MPPGFTPDSQNFVAPDGFLTPRSGLSNSDPFDFNGPVLGAAEVFDASGNLAGFAASATSFAFSHPDSPSWATLSYASVAGTGPAGIADIDDTPSGISTDYWETTSIYNKLTDKIIAVTSNNTNWPKWFAVEGSTTSFSDFTWVNSLDSMKASRGISAINDRLVFFNLLSSKGTRFPQRVLWSARGGATDFVLANGAGFEDLVSMRGEGTASVRFRDVLILFTDSEVWKAQPTLDDYAFRFQRITDEVGCPWARTATATPLGVMFMSRDFEVYATDGINILPVGPVQGQGPSRIQKRLRERLINPSRAWALYNQTERRYELYYATTATTTGFCDEALYYNIDDQTWWPQRFGKELSYGVELEDPSATLTWDEAIANWDTYNVGWDSFGDLQGSRWVTPFSGLGPIYSMRSDQTTDDGAAIDCRWQSHALRHSDRVRKIHLKELWVDYETDSNSSASVFVGSSYSGHNYGDGTMLSLTTNTSPAFVPTWYTSNAPVFELRVADGGLPRIAGFEAVTIDAGRF
jgi:hypothetical protein